jgi:hypothetical protein
MGIERICEIKIVNNCKKDAEKNIRSYKQRDGRQRIETNELNNLIKNKNVINHVRAQRLSWFGHVYRMAKDRMVRKLYE